MNRSTLFKASLFLVVTFLYASISYAQTEKSSEEEIKEALSKNEAAKKLKQEVGLLKEVFGIETKESSSKTNSNSGSGKKIIDVADDALQLTKGLVVSISETLQKVAPNVWRIMIKQQYVKSVSGVLVSWGIFFIFLVYTKVLQKKWMLGEHPSDDEKTARVALVIVIPILVCIGSGIVGVVCIANAFKYIINPEFYAIRDLLIMLLGSGS